jgi:hypothetical protein
VLSRIADVYLDSKQIEQFGRLLRTFFTLPYSTDLDGKDAETLIRIVKNATGPRSRRKELFDIIDGKTGYSVKTLYKSPNAIRVDLQEQRFCDVEEIRRMMVNGEGNNEAQGRILLSYMRKRITDQMKSKGIEVAKSLILLKFWDKERKHFKFRYWEEDFIGYIDNLWKRNDHKEIEWILQPAGIHARDRLRQDENGKNIRLLRMHHKHNQIFTDHDIPADSVRIEFDVTPLPWTKVAKLLGIA